MAKYYMIGWRAPGCDAKFFRGDRRYRIYLPYISTDFTSKGWVDDTAFARLFEAYPVFDFNDPQTRRCFSKKLDATRIRIFPYDGPVLQTHIIRPTKRP